MSKSNTPDIEDAKDDTASNPARTKHPVFAVFTQFIYIYVVGVMLSVPYFNWRYARDHGFVSWIFFGEVVATAQSVVWPMYAFSQESKPDWSDYERENIRHFNRVSDAIKQSAKIVNFGDQGGPSIIPTEDAQAIVSLHAFALKEARLVDANVLAKAHPELPQHFQNQLLPFLQTMNRVHDGTANFNEQVAAHKLFDAWVDWINTNRSEIRIPKGT